MTGLSFAHAESWPWVAAATVAVLGLVVFGAQRARWRAQRLLGPGRAHAAGRRDALLAGAAICIALALLGPRFGERSIWIPHAGLDLVVLIDTSRSMDARDTPPDRLTRARRVAREILHRLGPGDRAALAAFADRGVALTPLTPDVSALGELLGGVDAALIEPRGSNLAAGVRAALSIFDGQSERPRALVVLSDGEDPAGEEDTGGRAAESRGVRVFAVALGRDSGATLPDGDGALRDEGGKPVLSRRDRSRMASLVGDSGELWITNDFGDVDVEEIVASMRRELPGVAGAPMERRIPAERAGWLAAVALGMLWFESGRRPRRGAAALAGSAVLVAAVGGWASSEPREQLEAALLQEPRNAELLLRAGIAHAEADDADFATRRLEAASVFATEPEIAALSHYNLGVVALERGDYAAARDAFLDALAFDPEDPFARFNLEWSLFALRATPPEGGDPDPDSNKPPADRERPDPPEKGEETAESQPPEASSDGGKPDRAAPAEPAPESDLERWMSSVRDDPSRALRRAEQLETPRNARRLVW